MTRDRTGRTGNPRSAQESTPTTVSSRSPALLGAAVVAILGVVVAGFVLLSGGLSADAGPTSAGADDARGAAVVQGIGGQWSEVTVDQLYSMLETEDFALLNVKTPYSGEIEGTDLYIPYDRLTARADELPADRTATIVVYCRTGRQSSIAAQTLLDLGYTDIVNVDGGMTAWTASGRELIQVDRS
ncbi:MAG: rhodanese-like domain-containing protein [Chloroflexota bacterium]|jgi:rhodanese-related sulfurtransferase|nr:rhodanese-like domain-containing protein [Chloroflexota bacterium]MDH5242963.1 rhodanese-like domain-containing protein [Chloroflexota bacterium]